MNGMEWNRYGICLTNTNSHLPDFSFITKTDRWQVKQHYSFIAVLLHIPVCVVVDYYLLVDTFD